MQKFDNYIFISFKVSDHTDILLKFEYVNYYKFHFAKRANDKGI